MNRTPKVSGRVHRTKLAEYQTWHYIRRRCRRDSKLELCSQWETFEGFILSMGLRPGEGYRLVKHPEARRYGPETCIWAKPPHTFGGASNGLTRAQHTLRGSGACSEYNCPTPALPDRSMCGKHLRLNAERQRRFQERRRQTALAGRPPEREEAIRVRKPIEQPPATSQPLPASASDAVPVNAEPAPPGPKPVPVRERKRARQTLHIAPSSRRKLFRSRRAAA